jgi:uncharacterized pyridoxamine 5'-phosphate oxidase family protein
MSWQKALKRGNEIVLVSCTYKRPHGIFVISQGFIGKKLLINACQTKKTLKNILNNKNICIVAKRDGKYYRINGTAKVYSSGKYFKIGKERNKGPIVKKVIIASIKEVFDLDKVRKIL